MKGQDWSAAPEASRPPTAKVYVCNELSRLILDGVILSGARLIQSEIAARLGVSTTPVREALQDLAAEGLVQLDAHRGAVVTTLSMGELREIYGIRQLVEPHMVRLATPRMTSADLVNLDQLCDLMESSRDAGAWMELNRRFHAVFGEVCGWPRLAAMTASLHRAASPYMSLAMRHDLRLMANGNRDHRRMAAAARTGDVDDGVRCAMEHMNASLMAVESEDVSTAVAGQNSVDAEWILHEER